MATVAKYIEKARKSGITPSFTNDPAKAAPTDFAFTEGPSGQQMVDIGDGVLVPADQVPRPSASVAPGKWSPAEKTNVQDWLKNSKVGDVYAPGLRPSFKKDDYDRMSGKSGAPATRQDPYSFDPRAEAAKNVQMKRAQLLNHVFGGTVRRESDMNNSQRAYWAKALNMLHQSELANANARAQQMQKRYDYNLKRQDQARKEQLDFLKEQRKEARELAKQGMITPSERREAWKLYREQFTDAAGKPIEGAPSFAGFINDVYGPQKGTMLPGGGRPNPTGEIKQAPNGMYVQQVGQDKSGKPIWAEVDVSGGIDQGQSKLLTGVTQANAPQPKQPVRMGMSSPAKTPNQLAQRAGYALGAAARNPKEGMKELVKFSQSLGIDPESLANLPEKVQNKVADSWMQLLQLLDSAQGKQPGFGKPTNTALEG